MNQVNKIINVRTGTRRCPIHPEQARKAFVHVGFHGVQIHRPGADMAGRVQRDLQPRVDVLGLLQGQNAVRDVKRGAQHATHLALFVAQGAERAGLVLAAFPEKSPGGNRLDQVPVVRPHLGQGRPERGASPLAQCQGVGVVEETVVVARPAQHLGGARVEHDAQRHAQRGRPLRDGAETMAAPVGCGNARGHAAAAVQERQPGRKFIHRLHSLARALLHSSLSFSLASNAADSLALYRV